MDIKTTIVQDSGKNFIQIAPLATHPHRLPSCRNSALAGDTIMNCVRVLSYELAHWTDTPTPGLKDSIQGRLQFLSQASYSLDPSETWPEILDYRSSNDKKYRRLLYFMNSGASILPVEGLYIKADQVGFVDEFATVLEAPPISIVRQLELPEQDSTTVKQGKPLRMLVVLANIPENPLGEVLFEDGKLKFTGALEGETRVLEALKIFIQFGQLEIHFLVGDNEKTYQGEIQVEFDEVRWKTNGPLPYPLNIPQLRELLEGEKFHIFHYFGHGGFYGDFPSLRLSANENVSSNDFNGWENWSRPDIVVINACQSTGVNGALPVVGGFAPVFLEHGTVSLILMQMTVTPQTASRVTKNVYEQLGKSLFTDQDAIEIGLHKARQEACEADFVDFFCPVYYRRPVRGKIFNFQDNRMQVWGKITSRRKPVFCFWTAWSWLRKYLRSTASWKWLQKYVDFVLSNKRKADATSEKTGESRDRWNDAVFRFAWNTSSLAFTYLAIALILIGCVAFTAWGGWIWWGGNNPSITGKYIVGEVERQFWFGEHIYPEAKQVTLRIDLPADYCWFGNVRKVQLETYIPDQFNDYQYTQLEESQSLRRVDLPNKFQAIWPKDKEVEQGYSYQLKLVTTCEIFGLNFRKFNRPMIVSVN
jgi:hypothetical protein